MHGHYEPFIPSHAESPDCVHNPMAVLLHNHHMTYVIEHDQWRNVRGKQFSLVLRAHHQTPSTASARHFLFFALPLVVALEHETRILVQGLRGLSAS